MRYAIPTLFFILAFLVLLSFFSKKSEVVPEREAVAFISDLQSGNASKVVRNFGTNVCHCPKKRGWGAYLSYQTDEEPNLAFLLGHPFSIQGVTKHLVPSSPQAWHGVPWESPQDWIVNVSIRFDKNKYSPYFVPLPMAYGKPMSQLELADFFAHPDKEFWKGFTLRLRSTLGKGAIKFDTSTIDQDVRAEFKFLTEKQDPMPMKSWYLYPKDVGTVLSNDGKQLEAEQIMDKFPRLNSTTMQLRVVRSNPFQPWTIAEFDFKDPILEKDDGRLLTLSGRR